jgi:hypothetical protein
MRLVPMLAVAVLAMALYASRAVLDQLIAPEGLVRVALLPPWQSIGGFVAIGILALLWLDWRRAPGATATAVQAPLGPLLLPIFALLLLLIPYVPVLPDVVPALQILGGPIRFVLWLVVAAQLLWVLSQVRLLRLDWLQHATVKQLTIAIGVTTALVIGGAASRFTDTPLYPAGDEPHYLVMAQSLWRDGDLKIENNHTRGDYHEYFPGDLKPDFLTRGIDNEIYSIHPIGMPVLIAPVYGLGGYPAVIVAFVIMATIAAALMWNVTVALTNGVGAATFAWAAVALTSPFLFNAFAVYPEIPAALAVVIASAIILSPASYSRTRWLIVGLACAALPWLSTKYTPMSAALIAVALGRIIWTTDAARVAPVAPIAPLAPVAAALTVIPYGVSLLAWFYHFYATWGTPMPNAPYGALVQTEFKNVVFGVPGLLFDQEYGLLPYAPVYVLAITGLLTMWRSDRASRRIAIELVTVFATLLATVGAFRIWWGGSASPSRPLTSGLFLLALPIAVAFRSAPAGSARRAAQHMLLWTSLGIAVIMLVADNGFLTTNGRDGTSTLLEYLSPRWPLWSVVPSFIYHEAFVALMHTLAWLALAVGAALAIGRVRAGHPGTISLSVLAIGVASLFAALLVMPRLPLEPAWPDANVAARGRSPLLEAFDTTMRPVAIEYTPLHAEAATDVVARAALVLEPGARKGPQPARVLHNGRFSLPAGSYRIEVEWDGARTGESLGLQVGRTGGPWMSWPVNPEPGGRWSGEFSLPLDAAFVGFRGTPELERIVKRIRLVPTAVVDATHRPRTPEVLAASLSGDASVFYFDDNAFQEARGFWVRGERQTRVTIDHANVAAPLKLRVHSGPVANRLHIATGDFERDISLEPLHPIDIEIPRRQRLVTLALTAAREFVPRQLDPNSNDPRPLGVWIEVAQ